MDDVAQKAPAEQLTDKEQTPVAGAGRRPPVTKSELEDRAYYSGKCRNANVAQWFADRNCFVHLREKFTTVYAETIRHPDDEKTFDSFAPWQKIYPL